jgi:GDP-mannose 6-dehydrogenase
VAALYADLAAPVVRTDIRTAEMVKYADNAFHALKIAFANEIGALCHAEGIDSHHLMDIFILDTKLNLSAAYLRPGYAFGGSCLPKDLRALTHRAHTHQLAVPVLASVLPSNEYHKERAVAMIEAVGKRRLAVLGLSFKSNTDDLRESPAVELVEALLRKGYQLRIYDRNVSLARLLGANKDYIERGIPHISSLMVSDLEAAVAEADTVVVTSSDAAYRRVPAMLRPDQILIDLARIVDNPGQLGDRYRGIAW